MNSDLLIPFTIITVAIIIFLISKHFKKKNSYKEMVSVYNQIVSKIPENSLLEFQKDKMSLVVVKNAFGVVFRLYDVNNNIPENPVLDFNHDDLLASFQMRLKKDKVEIKTLHVDDNRITEEEALAIIFEEILFNLLKD